MVWDRLGDCGNVIEPFCGSAAFLLRRPHAPRIETINDADCMVANFWRATQHDPESVAVFADLPVNEADLHARHKFLVLSAEAKDFRRRMRSDPTYYDVRFAGWWCWGLCCWIGGGWCSDPDQPGRVWTNTENRPREVTVGVHADSNLTGELPHGNTRPCLASGPMGPGQGIHAIGERPENWQQVPMLSVSLGDDAKADGKPTRKRGRSGKNKRPDLADAGHGLNGLCEKIPNCDSRGVHAAAVTDDTDGLSPGRRPGIGQDGWGLNAGRPQLADAYDVGRGVNSHGDLGTCAARRAWLLDWFGRLRDRLRLVRVCCGDWLRVCDSESVTTRLGVTGVFFDPPYGDAAGRDMHLYAVDSGTVAAKVRAYCLERGDNPQMRIALCGYEGEGHEQLEAAGWEVVEWRAGGGYGNRSAKGKENARKERIWFSPHCLRTPGLFDQPAEAA
jgi:hypothetical protein